MYSKIDKNGKRGDIRKLNTEKGALMKKVLLICIGLLTIAGVLTYIVIIPEPINLVCNGVYKKTGKTKVGKLYVALIKYHILRRVFSGIESSEGILKVKTKNGNFEAFQYLRGGNYMVISKRSPNRISNEVIDRVDNMKGTYLGLSRKLSLRTQLEGYFIGLCDPAELNTEKISRYRRLKEITAYNYSCVNNMACYCDMRALPIYRVA